MDLEKREEYIRTILQAKEIDLETQNYVLKYVDMNQQLFGNVLDMDKLVDRIVIKNLHHSISTFDIKRNPLQGLLKTSVSFGSWNPYTHKIETNPIVKLVSKISKKAKQSYDSTIMHELDHCATNEYIDVTKEEKSQLLEKIQIPVLSKIFKIAFNTIFSKKFPVSGVLDYRQVIQNGLSLRNLNEGITAYKEEIYDNFLGYKSHTSYKAGKTVAKFIGEVIGTDELIRMHFDNDYNAMRVAFQEKTGQDLNTLVSKLNKESTIMTMFLGRLYTNHYARKMDKFMQTISLTQTQSIAERSFIPKCEIDHTLAIENAQNSNSRNNVVDKEIS